MILRILSRLLPHAYRLPRREVNIRARAERVCNRNSRHVAAYVRMHEVLKRGAK